MCTYKKERKKISNREKENYRVALVYYNGDIERVLILLCSSTQPRERERESIGAYVLIALYNACADVVGSEMYFFFVIHFKWYELKYYK